MECRDYSRIIQKDMDLLRDYFAAKLEGLKTVQEECIFLYFSAFFYTFIIRRENLCAFFKDSFEFANTEDGV